MAKFNGNIGDSFKIKNKNDQMVIVKIVNINYDRYDQDVNFSLQLINQNTKKKTKSSHNLKEFIKLFGGVINESKQTIGQSEVIDKKSKLYDRVYTGQKTFNKKVKSLIMKYVPSAKKWKKKYVAEVGDVFYLYDSGNKLLGQVSKNGLKKQHGMTIDIKKEIGIKQSSINQVPYSQYDDAHSSEKEFDQAFIDFRFQLLFKGDKQSYKKFYKRYNLGKPIFAKFKNKTIEITNQYIQIAHGKIDEEYVLPDNWIKVAKITK